MSTPAETGVLSKIFIPRFTDHSSAVEPIQFGTATINPKHVVFAGTFQHTDDCGREVHSVKVWQAHSDMQVAFCGIDEIAALELSKLLRYVLEGRISLATYKSEVPLWSKQIEEHASE
jgi:hypothetical protein